jgi:hypothetical protein
MMDRKDHVINTLTQLNDDLRNKLVNLSADAGMQLAAKDEQIAKLTEALRKPNAPINPDHAINGHDITDAADAVTPET